MRLLEGKLALITGAAQGNGLAIARAIAAAGARIVIADQNATGAAAAAAELVAHGHAASGETLDVTDLEACRTLARRIGHTEGPIDVLVNNAGVLPREGMDSPTHVATFRRTMEINLFGALHVTSAFLPALKANRGAIVNVASIASFRAISNSVGYAPSKAALRMLTLDLARELAPSGVRVNAIAPGVIETPMTAATMADPARLGMFLSKIPMGRVGQPEELGGPIVFLCSDAASYVTGAVLPVDGGFLT